MFLFFLRFFWCNFKVVLKSFFFLFPYFVFLFRFPFDISLSLSVLIGPPLLCSRDDVTPRPLPLGMAHDDASRVDGGDVVRGGC